MIVVSRPWWWDAVSRDRDEKRETALLLQKRKQICKKNLPFAANGSKKVCETGPSRHRNSFLNHLSMTHTTVVLLKRTAPVRPTNSIFCYQSWRQLCHKSVTEKVFLATNQEASEDSFVCFHCDCRMPVVEAMIARTGRNTCRILSYLTVPTKHCSFVGISSHILSAKLLGTGYMGKAIDRSNTKHKCSSLTTPGSIPSCRRRFVALEPTLTPPTLQR